MHAELAVSLSQLAHTVCEVVAQSYKAVTQNEFLQRLGIEARLHQLLANAKDGTNEYGCAYPCEAVGFSHVRLSALQ